MLEGTRPTQDSVALGGIIHESRAALRRRCRACNRTNHRRRDGGHVVHPGHGHVVEASAAVRGNERTSPSPRPRHRLCCLANHWNSPTLRSSGRQDAHSGAKGEQLGDDTNRRQFQAALLENCSFFAELVLRQVRGEGDLWRESLERSSSREQLNVLQDSPKPPGSKADVVPGQRPETETPSSLLPTLWIEVGCHAARRLSMPKRSAHEYGEDPKPAL